MYVLPLHNSALIGKAKHLSVSGGSTPTVCLEQMPVSHMSAVKIQKEKTPTSSSNGSAVSQVVACVLLGEACTTATRALTDEHRTPVDHCVWTDLKIPDNC